MHFKSLLVFGWGAVAGIAHAQSSADGPSAASATTAFAQQDSGCGSLHDFVATDCSLTWNGITLYGAYDVGVGWVSHGLPENGYN